MFLGKQKLHEKKRNTSFSKTHRVKEKLLESPFVRKVTLPRVAKMIPRWSEAAVLTIMNDSQPFVQG